MKKVLLLLLAVSLTMTSCKKEETEEQPETTVGSGKITLSLDGGDLVDFPIHGASSMGGKIYLNGINGNKELTINVNDPTLGPGTYTNDELGISYSENSLAVFDDVTNATNEEYVITEHNQSSHHITGSYQLTFNDNNTGNPRTAQGTFDVTYVVIN